MSRVFLTVLCPCGAPATLSPGEERSCEKCGRRLYVKPYRRRPIVA